MPLILAGKDIADVSARQPIKVAAAVSRRHSPDRLTRGQDEMRAAVHFVRILTLCVAAAVATCCIQVSALAQTDSRIALKPMTVEGAFLGEKQGKRATDISGIACMPPSDTGRICLLVNDENKNAQRATIEGDRLIVGTPIELIGDEPDPKTLGRKPNIACPKEGDFEDLDGEGVTYSEPYFYVIGSHGCSRKRGEFRLSSFILARIRVDHQGRLADAEGKPLSVDRFADAVQTTYRVSDLLQRAGAAAAFLGKDLNSANGLNIEGIAVHGDNVWLGLRGPVDDEGNAFLVGGSAADLFRDGQAPSQATPEVIQIKLEKLGVRDIDILPDKRILVLAGNGPEKEFQLFVVDTTSGAVKPLGKLPEVKQMVEGNLELGKAEAVTVLDRTADSARIVVLFDALLDGAPHEGKVTLK